MNKKGLGGLLITASILLTGCTVPPLNFTVPNVTTSTNKLDAELKLINVTLATQDQKIGTLGAGDEVAPGLWKSSLEEAVNRINIFNDDSNVKLSLLVKVLGFEASALAYTVTSRARYDLLDRKTGKVIYSKEITTEGYDNTFQGVTRLRTALNNSVQNNISDFIQSIEAYAATKPSLTNN